jgi:hypothetical protein
MGRGIKKTAIFRKEEDRKDFLNRIAVLCQGKACDLKGTLNGT